MEHIFNACLKLKYMPTRFNIAQRKSHKPAEKATQASLASSNDP